MSAGSDIILKYLYVDFVLLEAKLQVVHERAFVEIRQQTHIRSTIDATLVHYLDLSRCDLDLYLHKSLVRTVSKSYGFFIDGNGNFVGCYGLHLYRDISTRKR